jgi:hypothetical protein
MTDKWTVQLEEDENGELVLPLPAELLAQMGWDIGDELAWEEAFDGAFSLKKIDKEQ